MIIFRSKDIVITFGDVHSYTFALNTLTLNALRNQKNIAMI